MDRSALTPLCLNGRTVDFQRGSVTDEAGHSVTLRPQAAEVLKVLAARPGEIVTKDELMQAVWGNIAVTDDSLVQCVIEIRKALGDDKHEIVRTLPKRGYVLEAGEDGDKAAGIRSLALRRKSWLGLAAGLVILIGAAGAYLWPTTKSGAEPPAIAVLPFANLSEDAKWDRFADGMTEDVISDLARFRDIPVIARTSTEVYRGKAHDVREIGKALDVEYVLEGSLRIDLHRLRVTAQLVNAKSGEHVWSERYDGQAGDFFAVQDEITEKIVATLTGWQSPISQERKVAAQRKSANQLDAYDYWLLGVAEKHRMTPASMIEARKLLENGLALDPDFQPLVRDLAFTYSLDLWMGTAKDRDLAMREYVELSARAVELDPQDPLAWFARSDNANWRGEKEEQRRHYEHALSLGPSNADLLVLAASNAAYVAAAERGPELADRALRLNPHHPHWWNTMLVPAYLHGRAFAKAYPFARKLGLESPQDAAHQAIIAAQLDRPSEATEVTAAVLRLDPEWTAEAYYPLPMERDQGLIAEGARKAGLPVCLTAAQIETNPPRVRYADCEQKRAKAAALN